MQNKISFEVECGSMHIDYDVLRKVLYAMRKSKRKHIRLKSGVMLKAIKGKKCFNYNQVGPSQN